MLSKHAFGYIAKMMADQANPIPLATNSEPPKKNEPN